MKRYYAKPGNVLCLGRQGENEARQIVFDLAPWERLYGSGTVQLLAQRSGEKTPYPVALETEENFVVWTVRTADTEIAGRCGQCELQYYAGDALAKSAIWRTVVYEALEGPVGPVPEPEETWVSQVLQAGANAKEAAEHAQQAQQEAADNAEAALNAANQAEAAAIRQPYPNQETGTWWVWNAETGAYTDTGEPAQGPRGDSGLPDVVGLTGSEQSLTLANNTEYRCADPVTGLTISGFLTGPEGKTELWSIQFTAGETITVTVPDTVIWAVAEPVFTPGSTYWITWTPMGEKYLAVWVEVEADESTDV